MHPIKADVSQILRSSFPKLVTYSKKLINWWSKGRSNFWGDKILFKQYKYIEPIK